MGRSKPKADCCNFHKDGIVVYVDGVDWQHEIGQALGGNKIFPDLEDLKQNNPCWEGCGVVRCRVTFEEWVEPQDLWKGGGVTGAEIEAERKLKGDRQIKLEHYNSIKAYFEKQIESLNSKIERLKGETNE